MRKLLYILLFVFAVLPLYSEEKKIITILDLETKEMSEIEMRSIISRLSSELFQTDKYIVIDVAERENILNEIKFSLSGCTDSACQIEVGKMLSAEMIVTGSLSKIGSKFLLSVKMLDTATTRTVNTADGTYESLDLLVDDLDKIAKKLAGIEIAGTSPLPAKPAKSEKQEPSQPRKVLTVSSYALGAAGAVVGGIFIYQAVNSYNNNYLPAVDNYYGLEALASSEEYNTAAALVSETHSDFMKKTYIGGTASAIGICSLAAGIILSLLPDSPGSSARVEPAAEGLSFSYSLSY